MSGWGRASQLHPPFREQGMLTDKSSIGKRGMELLYPPYAKYGMTIGSTEPSRETKSCGIISWGWPTWVFAAQKLGIEVWVVLVKETTWSSIIRRVLPNSELRVVREPSEYPSVPMVDLWLCDVEPPRSLRLFDRPQRPTLVSRRRVRYPTSDTHVYTHRKCRHDDLGGVTDASWDVHIYHPLNSEVEWELPVRGGRDMRVIIDPLVSGRPCQAPPKTNSSRPQTLLLRPGVYHSGGLYPSKVRNPSFVAPSVYSVTGWVRRKLTGREVCLINDIPGESYVLLDSREVALVCQKLVFPLKIGLAVLETWKHQASIRVEELSEPRVKRSCTEPKLTFQGVTQPGTTDGLTKDENRKLKAAKADDAEVPEFLWNRQLVPEEETGAVAKLTVLRSFTLRWCKRNLCRDFIRWFLSEYNLTHSLRGYGSRSLSYQAWIAPLLTVLTSDRESGKNWVAGRECVSRYCNSSWWEWTEGSRPHFWRWPQEYRSSIRDGVPPWFKTKVPKWQVPQRPEKNEEVREAMRKKLEKIRRLKYIQEGHVDSLTSYFAVPKGETDIRMVYDGTKSGLNDSLWAPWFALPTIQTHLRFVGAKSHMGDIDVGDMFHNYVLHEAVQRVAGIDLTPFFPEELETRANVRMVWERWVRSAMGLKNSPYNAIQGALIMDEVIRGNKDDPRNIFHWDFVRLNLPGQINYRPELPWVSKVRSEDGEIACDFVSYVDDTRTCGNSGAEARAASRRVASTMNWLGIQDAARKRRDPCQDPGPWAGSVVRVQSNGVVCVSVTVERWNKARAMVQWILEAVETSDTIEFKTLEKYRGYLVYISRTYPVMTPYLKGVHLTLDSWRPWRKDDGWKMTMAEIREACEDTPRKDDAVGLGEVGTSKAPSHVKWVPRLVHDIRALRLFLSPQEPPQWVIRPKPHSVVVYSFGDASGSGFGSSLLREGTLTHYSGQWVDEVGENSSNFRELANLVNLLELAREAGTLKNSEVFVFTDNSTAESAFFKGTSSSEALLDLILRLQCVQMHGEVILHLVHVAGRRMISQGTDGLSRGLSSEGAMGGQDFLSFVPLHIGALDREPDTVKEWVESWFVGERQPSWLTPEDWYGVGHTTDRSVWAPAPAAADAALEQLAKATHKRTHLTHLVIIPRLMTSTWRRMLSKICDVVFTVPCGTDVWPNINFEPLIVGLCLPLLKRSPWKLRGTNFVADLERELRGLPPNDFRRSRIVLREFFHRARELDRLPASVVRPLLQAARQWGVPSG